MGSIYQNVVLVWVLLNRKALNMKTLRALIIVDKLGYEGSSSYPLGEAGVEA